MKFLSLYYRPRAVQKLTIQKFKVNYSESKKWIEKKEVKKFIHENIEVQFNLVTKGFYDQNTETQVREFCAKLISIEHSTI